MSTLSSKIDAKVLDEYTWENIENWIHCICIVNFDLELGQALEVPTEEAKNMGPLMILLQGIYPRHVTLTKQEVSNICYLAFPDSNSGCMGDTTFVIRLPNSPGKNTRRNEHVQYNNKCTPVLQIHSSYYWGFVYFRQVKDIKLPRGYFQKVSVSRSHFSFMRGDHLHLQYYYLMTHLNCFYYEYSKLFLHHFRYKKSIPKKSSFVDI